MKVTKEDNISHHKKYNFNWIKSIDINWILVQLFIWHFSTETKVLISTGFPLISGNKTEVIDLESSNVQCKDLEDFPIEYSQAVYANLASMPIICGGWFWKCPDNCTQDPQNCPQNCPHSSDKCFIYKKGGWQHFVNMRNRRSAAAGIVYNNAFHIFGGHDTDENTKLQSSEIVHEDGTSTEGPQLPSPIHGHAIASVNSTVSIRV